MKMAAQNVYLAIKQQHADTAKAVAHALMELFLDQQQLLVQKKTGSSIKQNAQKKHAVMLKVKKSADLHAAGVIAEMNALFVEI